MLTVGTALNSNTHDPWHYNRDSPPESVPVELLPTLTQMANSRDDRDVLQGVLLIRKLLSVDNPPTQEVVDTGVVPKLVHCMHHPNLDLQHEASWALCNMTANIVHGHHIIDLQVVPLWVSHLSSPNTNCVAQAVLAIGKIVEYGAKCRNHVLESGALPPLLNVIQSIENCSGENLALMQSAARTLSNLCRFKPQPAIDRVAPAVPILVQLLQYPDLDVVHHSLWALSYICDGPQDRVQLVIDSGVVPRVVYLLGAEHDQFNMPAISIIGNICSCDNEQIQTVIDAGCLPRMARLLDPKVPREVRKVALWALSNIAAVGSAGQIQALLDAELLPLVISAIGASEQAVSKEAIWVCANLASNGMSEPISFIVECGVLEALFQVLVTKGEEGATEGLNVRLVAIVLQAILEIIVNGAELVSDGTYPTNIYVDRIRSFQGESIIKNLNEHSDSGIQSLVQDIADYFDNDNNNIVNDTSPDS